MPKLSKSQHFGVQCYRKAIELYGKIDEDGEPYIELAEWREIFYRDYENDNQSTLRSAFNRTLENLLENGAILEANNKYIFSNDYALEKSQIKKLIRARKQNKL